MQKLIQSVSASTIIYSFLIIVILGSLVIYWDRKRIKDRNKIKKKGLTPFQKDCLLDYDDSEKFYQSDEREVEYYK